MNGEKAMGKVNFGKGKNAGFSLVELIIVIAIIAILTSILVPSLLRYIVKAQKAADIATADSIGTTMQYNMYDPTDEGSRALWDYVSINAGQLASEKKGNAKKYYRILAYQSSGTVHKSFDLQKSNNAVSKEQMDLARQQMKDVIVDCEEPEFQRNNYLDQWVICCDTEMNIYVFITAGCNGGQYYMDVTGDPKDGLCTISGNGGKRNCYMLWPEVGQAYTDLRNTKDSLDVR